MNKLFKGEKAGLNLGISKVNILLISLFFSFEIFPQTPINGFGEFKKLPVDSGYTSLFSIPQKNGYLNNLVLYNPERNRIVTLISNKEELFKETKTSEVPIEFSKIRKIYDNNKIIGYAFASRKKLMSGIYDFNEDGKPELLKAIKFSSYPDNISVGDVSLNGEPEFLVSGSAFQGLSLLSENSTGFSETKITTKASYSSAVFIDLDNDGYPDIAAYNLFSNTLDFFYNNSRGVFKLVRSFKMNNKIQSLHAVDFDNDSYQDLLYVKDNSIIIKYGDFTASYDTTVTITTSFHPDKFLVGDFNKDGKLDIAYADFDEGIISVIYNKNKFNFYPEIYLFKNLGIRDIALYFFENNINIAAISDKGNLFVVSRIRSFEKDVNISLAVKPSLISYFDYNNDGIYDLCYVDDFDNNFDLIVRNKAGIPAYFYSYPLFEHHSKIIIDDTEPLLKKFYFYEPDKKLIEIITADLKSDKFERTSLYSPGKIKDVKLNIDKEIDNIYVAYSKETTLNLALFEYKNMKYVFREFPNVASNAYGVNIDLVKNPKIFFWKKEKDSFGLYSKNISNTEKTADLRFYVPFSNDINITSISGDLFNEKSSVYLSFFNSKVSNFAVVSSDSSTSKISLDESQNNFRIKTRKQLFFGAVKFNGLKRLCVSLPNNNEIVKIEFLNKGRKISASKLIDAENVDDFFIKNLDQKIYHLIYTDNKENIITIKNIK